MQNNIRIRNCTEGCTIDIEGTIGVPEEWQFEEPAQRVATYEAFCEAVHRIGSIDAPQVVVNIRSTGGDVNDALLIYDALRALDVPRIVTRCYGYTASAATIIAQAASEGCREISPSALYLIHNAICAAEGNAGEIEAHLDLLHQTDRRLAALYAARGGRSEEEMAALMAQNNGCGRWLSPREAFDAGLVDCLIGGEPIQFAAGTGVAAEAAEPAEDGTPKPQQPENDTSPKAQQSKRAATGGRGLFGRWRGRSRNARSRGDLPDPVEDRNILHAEDDPLLRTARSIVAMKQAQRQVAPTSTLPCEDPAVREVLRRPNEQAYAEDARRLVKGF